MISPAMWSLRWGLALCAAYLACPLPLLSQETNTTASTQATSALPPAIIDAHMHIVNDGLPGDEDGKTPDGQSPLGPYAPAERDRASAIFMENLEREMLAAGVSTGLCMPRWPGGDEDPLGIAETLRLAAMAKRVRLYAIGLANPERTNSSHLSAVRTALKTGSVKAFKAYLAYAHYYPSNPRYQPYYELAEEFVQRIVPEKFWKRVFYENAKTLFKLE